MIRFSICIALSLLAATSARAGGAATLDLSVLDIGGGRILHGVDSVNESGYRVCAAGDLNGDGVGDLLVSAPLADADADFAGMCYVVFGTELADVTGPFVHQLADLDGSNGFALQGVDFDDRAGRSVAAAGDVNGDGLDDILIGAPNADPGGRASAGKCYVVFGSNAGFPASLPLASLDGSNGFVLEGIGAGNQAATSVAGAGDVDGDGIDDIVIGAWGANPGGRLAAGETYVVFGSDLGFPALLPLSSLDGSNGFVLEGIDPDDYSGYGVDGAGDVNGDGFADLVVGAWYAEGSGPNRSGEAYVVFGSGAGFPATFELATLDGMNGFRINGAAIGDQAGVSVAGAGDVDGDGYDDVVVGAHRAKVGNLSNVGAAYVVFGGPTGVLPATVELAGVDGTNGFAMRGVAAEDFTGATVAAGDVNGDGLGDILVGSSMADPGGDPSAGTCYVVYGRASAYAAEIDLGALDGVVGTAFLGIDAGDLSATGLAAGDVNGDGIDDILLGAPDAAPNGISSGETYVIFGVPRECAQGTVDITSGAPADVLYVNGSAGEEDRAALIGSSDLLVVTMLKPPSGGSGKFVLQASGGRPSSTTQTTLPASIGKTCLPFLLADGAVPVLVANGIGKEHLVGESNVFGLPLPDPDAASTSFAYDPLPLGTVLTFQAVIIDPASASPKGASATNAVIVQVVD